MDASPAKREPTTTALSAPEVPAYPAPLPDPVPTSSIETETDETDEERKEEDLKETEAEETLSSLDPHGDPASGTNGVEEVEPERLSVVVPACHLEDSLESPIVQPEELCLPNGLPLPAPQDPEALAVNTAERDDSPIAEPEVIQPPPTQTSLQTSAAVAETPSAPTVQPTPVTVDQLPSPPAAEESPVETDSQATPAPPEDHDAAPEEPLDAQEDVSVPQSSVKEEMTPPSETVSLPEISQETLPTVPTPPEEEREDTPPLPLTVTPALVEMSMQG